MTALKTGRRYEIVFGPGISLAAGTDADMMDSVFREVASIDPDAIVLSASSDGVKVIGSETKSAIDAGRAVCSIRCRVFDRRSHLEMSTETEFPRNVPAEIVWSSPIAAFDPRSSHEAAGKRKSNFKFRS